VVDHWWQTETGWPICANPRGLEPLPIKPGSPSVPVPGFRVRVVDQRGAVVPANTEGSIVVELPLPPGCLSGLWNDDDRFRRSYLDAFPGNYHTGDGGYLDEDGYLFVLRRTDDVINVAGHRLSTGVMEAVTGAHPSVAECAVIGVHDELKGEIPSAYVVLTKGAGIDDEALRAELIGMVRGEIGAVAALRMVTVVEGLPKTRSGKILRRTLRRIAQGEDVETPPTIEDPSVLDALVRTIG
jgi:propionyl-CoA synthetase